MGQLSRNKLRVPTVSLSSHESETEVFALREYNFPAGLLKVFRKVTTRDCVTCDDGIVQVAA
jgi:hypothetical protein